MGKRIAHVVYGRECLHTSRTKNILGKKMAKSGRKAVKSTALVAATPPKEAAAALPATVPGVPADVIPLEAPMFHSSTVQITATGNDFILTFLTAQPAIQNGRPAQVALTKPVAIVTVSPQTGKDLAILLGRVVADQERKYGELVTAFTQSLGENAKAPKTRH